jgi:alpha-N-acetylgalactosaminidase
MDGCNSLHSRTVMDPAYEYMGAALNKTGRPILYSCSWPFYVSQNASLWTAVAAACNLWRFSPDIQDSWQSVQGVIDFVGDYGGNLTHPSPWRAVAGPGGWNMPNVLVIGNFALSRTQAETQMALWSIMAAPLLMGNDLRTLDPEMKRILLAEEVIAVDQDSLGKQGGRVVHFPCSANGDCGCCAHDVWVRELANGDLAVVLWFRGEDGTHGRVTAAWSDLGIPDINQKYAVRDLFKRQDLGVFDKEFSAFVDIDGVVMVRMTPLHEHKVYPPYTPTRDCSAADWVHTIGSFDTSCSHNVTAFSGLTPEAALARCCANPSCAGFSITQGSSGCSGYFKEDANCGNSTGFGYEGWTRRAAIPTWAPGGPERNT